MTGRGSPPDGTLDDLVAELVRAGFAVSDDTGDGAGPRTVVCRRAGEHGPETVRLEERSGAAPGGGGVAVTARGPDGEWYDADLWAAARNRERPRTAPAPADAAVELLAVPRGVLASVAAEPDAVARLRRAREEREADRAAAAGGPGEPGVEGPPRSGWRTDPGSAPRLLLALLLLVVGTAAVVAAYDRGVLPLAGPFVLLLALPLLLGLRHRVAARRERRAAR